MTKKYTKFLSFAAFVAAGVLSLSASSSAYAIIDLNVGGSASSTSSATASSSSSGGSSATSSNTSTRSSANVTSSTSLDLSSDMMSVGSSLEIKRADAEADTDTTVLDSSDVSTNADLRSYARASMRSDTEVEGMKFERGTVEVKYKEKGRFLALLPMTFTVTARAHANGDIEINYPWYSFLTVDNKDQVETDMKVAIDNTIRSRMVGGVQAEGEAVDASFTAAESASVASEMQRILKANFKASSNTSAETTY